MNFDENQIKFAYFLKNKLWINFFLIENYFNLKLFYRFFFDYLIFY